VLLEQIDALLASNKTLRTLDRLAKFTGQEPTYDCKLGVCIDQVESNGQKWALLPYAVAATYYSDLWAGTKYIIEHDAYSGNESMAFKVCLVIVIVLIVMGLDGLGEDSHFWLLACVVLCGSWVVARHLLIFWFV